MVQCTVSPLPFNQTNPVRQTLRDQPKGHRNATEMHQKCTLLILCYIISQYIMFVHKIQQHGAHQQCACVPPVLYRGPHNVHFYPSRVKPAILPPVFRIGERNRQALRHFDLLRRPSVRPYISIMTSSRWCNQKKTKPINRVAFDLFTPLANFDSSVLI